MPYANSDRLPGVCLRGGQCEHPAGCNYVGYVYVHQVSLRFLCPRHLEALGYSFIRGTGARIWPLGYWASDDHASIENMDPDYAGAYARLIADGVAEPLSLDDAPIPPQTGLCEICGIPRLGHNTQWHTRDRVELCTADLSGDRAALSPFAILPEQQRCTRCHTFPAIAPLDSDILCRTCLCGNIPTEFNESLGAWEYAGGFSPDPIYATYLRRINDMPSHSPYARRHRVYNTHPTITQRCVTCGSNYACTGYLEVHADGRYHWPEVCRSCQRTNPAFVMGVTYDPTQQRGGTQVINVCIHRDVAVCNTNDEYATLEYAENDWRRVRACGDEYCTNPDCIWTWEARDEQETSRDNGRHIYGYHETNPITAFGWPRAVKRNALCFGVELEMEGVRSRVTQVDLCNALGGKKDSRGRFILATDGSLNESGVELITSPYTLGMHQTEFGWDELLGRVAEIGRSGRGTTACGMHVHVNRKALSAYTLGKVLVFVNHANNRALIESVAQRGTNHYSTYIPKRLRDGSISQTSKYEAVHLTQNTAEFRIFRGNLRPARVLKNIEFCHAVVHYCRQASAVTLGAIKPFLDYVYENRKTYPNLAAFLAQAKKIEQYTTRPVLVNGDL